jgi:hypothetical protein
MINYFSNIPPLVLIFISITIISASILLYYGLTRTPEPCITSVRTLVKNPYYNPNLDGNGNLNTSRYQFGKFNMQYNPRFMNPDIGNVTGNVPLVDAEALGQGDNSAYYLQYVNYNTTPFASQYIQTMPI